MKTKTGQKVNSIITTVSSKCLSVKQVSNLAIEIDKMVLDILGSKYVCDIIREKVGVFPIEAEKRLIHLAFMRLEPEVLKDIVMEVIDDQLASQNLYLPAQKVIKDMPDIKACVHTCRECTTVLNQEVSAAARKLTKFTDTEKNRLPFIVWEVGVFAKVVQDAKDSYIKLLDSECKRIQRKLKKAKLTTFTLES